MRFLPRTRTEPDGEEQPDARSGAARVEPPSSGPESLLSKGLPHLIDERSDPNFRSVFGLFAGRAGALDTAISRIRLSGLDLRPRELKGLERIRVLLAEVNALSLSMEAEAVLADPEKGRNLRNVVSLMEAGRIQVRAAPLAGWAPDFSVFHRLGRPWTLLVGLHWFARPYPHRGPALASLHGSGAAALGSRRFGELWRVGHDIGPAILGVLQEATRRGAERAPAPSRRGSTPWKKDAMPRPLEAASAARSTATAPGTEAPSTRMKTRDAAGAQDLEEGS